MSWLEFWQALLPSLLELGRDLFERTSGDPAAAVVCIRDHQQRLRSAEAAIDQRIEKAAAKKKG